jgi:hypothetical protein
MTNLPVGRARLFSFSVYRRIGHPGPLRAGTGTGGSGFAPWELTHPGGYLGEEFRPFKVNEEVGISTLGSPIQPVEDWGEAGWILAANRKGSVNLCKISTKTLWLGTGFDARMHMHKRRRILAAL